VRLCFQRLCSCAYVDEAQSKCQAWSADESDGRPLAPAAKRVLEIRPPLDFTGPNDLRTPGWKSGATPCEDTAMRRLRILAVGLFLCPGVAAAAADSPTRAPLSLRDSASTKPRFAPQANADSHEAAPQNLRDVVKRPSSPPPAKEGCYENKGAEWVETPCASDDYVKKHIAPHVLQYAIQSDGRTSNGKTTAAQSLVFGMVWDQFVSVGSITDTLNGPDAFSIQNNTNLFKGKKGHTYGVQFTTQASPGNPDSVCITQADVTTQNYNNTTCINYPHPRAAGLKDGDYAVVEGWVRPGRKLSVEVLVSWSDQPSTWEGVTVSDAFGLIGQWTEVSGGPLGEQTPLGSKVPAVLDFSYAKITNTLAASTCSAQDFDYANVDNPCPKQPAFKPSASVTEAGYPLAGTFEGNNLELPSAPPTLVWPNVDFVTTAFTTKLDRPAEAQCKLTGCSGPSNWSADVSCTGRDVGIIYNGACHDTAGEQTPCRVGFNGSSSATAMWNAADFGAPGAGVQSLQGETPDAPQACTQEGAGGEVRCITVSTAKFNDLPACPAPSSGPTPAHQCGQGERWCDKFAPARCAPDEQCLLQAPSSK
jgi:hypothetical protein